MIGGRQKRAVKSERGEKEPGNKWIRDGREAKYRKKGSQERGGIHRLVYIQAHTQKEGVGKIF